MVILSKLPLQPHQLLGKRSLKEFWVLYSCTLFALTFLSYQLLVSKPFCQEMTVWIPPLNAPLLPYKQSPLIMFSPLAPVLLHLYPNLVFLIPVPRHSWPYMLLLIQLPKHCWPCKIPLPKRPLMLPLGVSSLTPYEIQPSLTVLPVTSHTIIDEEKQEQNCSMREKKS